MNTTNLKAVLIDAECKCHQKTCSSHLHISALGMDGASEMVRSMDAELPGLTTSNQAAYGSILAALKYANELTMRLHALMDKHGTRRHFDITITSSNKVVVDQINGSARCKQAQLRELLDQVTAKVRDMGVPVQIQWLGLD